MFVPLRRLARLEIQAIIYRLKSQSICYNVLNLNLSLSPSVEWEDDLHDCVAASSSRQRHSVWRSIDVALMWSGLSGTAATARLLHSGSHQVSTLSRGAIKLRKINACRLKYIYKEKKRGLIPSFLQIRR